MFWEREVPTMSKNIERSQNWARSFENTKKRAFLVKLQALNLQLYRKINSTTSIFQLICLPFKNNCLSKETSKKSKNFEIQCKLCYCKCIALHFQLLQLVCLTDQWSTFYKSRMSCLSGQTYFQVQAIKKKGKHEKYSVEVQNEKYIT